MPSSTNRLRDWLRSQPTWLKVQEARREGFGNVWNRRWYQRQILGTPPLRTQPGPGRVEVRALTWRRDWMNLLWALKSFYHFAQVDYPLYIHDGGLLPEQFDQIQQHFPDATLIPRAEADPRVQEELTRRGLARSLEYRLKNPSTRKLFDFFVFSDADYLISIDSDIVFFRRPDLLLPGPGEEPARNLYNRDASDQWYSMTPDELDAAFGIRPLPRVNSGLSLIRRESIDFDAIERWLHHPQMFDNNWVTEQTLHALCATVHGMDFLPPTYLVDTEAGGMSDDLVCKHYPGFFRKHLYSEGMRRLIRSGFLDALRRGSPSTGAAAGRDGREAP